MLDFHALRETFGNHACAGTAGFLGSVAKTNQLALSMKPAEVKAILGDPSQTQFVSDKWVCQYSLHEYWKGYVPYYLVFSHESPTLRSWYPDEAEYLRQQQLWLQAIPPTQKHEIELQVKPTGQTRAAREPCS